MERGEAEDGESPIPFIKSLLSASVPPGAKSDFWPTMLSREQKGYKNSDPGENCGKTARFLWYHCGRLRTADMYKKEFNSISSQAETINQSRADHRQRVQSIGTLVAAELFCEIYENQSAVAAAVFIIWNRMRPWALVWQFICKQWTQNLCSQLNNWREWGQPV